MINHIIQAISQNPFSGVLLIFLIFCSLVSWSIIFLKWKAIMRQSKNSSQFINHFWQTKDFAELKSKAKSMSCASAEIFSDGIKEYERQMISKTDKKEALLLIERSLIRIGQKHVREAEKYLIVLATIGAISPFIGLLGTVLGIMNAFKEIAVQQNANLSTVAPGISEALFATALGLFAAIPAVMAFNFFQNSIGKIKADLESFCGDILAVLKSQSV